jgi:hypothetical protein
MFGRRTRQTGGKYVIKRPQQLTRGLPKSYRRDRRSGLQHLQHADRDKRTVLALLAVLLVRAARHVIRHVLHVCHLHGGHRMSRHRRCYQRRNRQPGRHEDREQEPEEAASNHAATLSQGRNAGKRPGSQMREQGTLVVNCLGSANGFLANETGQRSSKRPHRSLARRPAARRGCVPAWVDDPHLDPGLARHLGPVPLVAATRLALAIGRPLGWLVCMHNPKAEEEQAELDPTRLGCSKSILCSFANPTPGASDANLRLTEIG